MATEQWIESAARAASRPVGTEYMSADHLLAMARADEQYEATERIRARRMIERVGGEDVADVLEMLGLDAEVS